MLFACIILLAPFVLSFPLKPKPADKHLRFHFGSQFETLLYDFLTIAAWIFALEVFFFKLLPATSRQPSESCLEQRGVTLRESMSQNSPWVSMKSGPQDMGWVQSSVALWAAIEEMINWSVIHSGRGRGVDLFFVDGW